MPEYIQLDNHEALGKRVWVDALSCSGTIVSAFGEFSWSAPSVLICLIAERNACIPLHNDQYSIIH